MHFECAPSRDVPAIQFVFQLFYSLSQMGAPKPVYTNKQICNMLNIVRSTLIRVHIKHAHGQINTHKH